MVLLEPKRDECGISKCVGELSNGRCEESVLCFTPAELHFIANGNMVMVMVMVYCFI